MSTSIDTLFWSSLGKKGPQMFGEECGSAALWMFLALFQRCILMLLRIDRYVPSGLIFAFPLVIHCISKHVPFMRGNYPILPVRIAEGIMGRISPANLMVVIPAHFLGSVLGIVIFKTLFPFLPTVVFQPVVFNALKLNHSLLIEAFAVFAYVLITLVLPELIEVNKLNPQLLSVALFPLLLLRSNGSWCTFNPAIVYALWYVNRAASGSLYDVPSVLQLLHIVAPFLGAVLAGLFCNYMFPDSPSSWKRRSERIN